MNRASFANLISDQQPASPSEAHALRKRAWLDGNLGTLYPHEIQDPSLRERIVALLNAMFGQRN